MSRYLLPLIPAGLSVAQVLPAPDRITIVTTPVLSQSACPLCGGVSGRVHSHYTRTLDDLPWQGRVVVLQLRARRFRCATAGCPRRIFAERLPAAVAPHARRTARLGDIQRHIGLALGGEPGSRLAARLAMPISGDTLLRLVRAVEPQPRRPPRVVGIDEWAWRRGLTYGTILCDLERGQVIDLLPDRTSETVSAWLKQHPTVAIIARDRASVYAGAIQQGAPEAIEVADRWHLLRNLGDALRAAVGRYRKAITTAADAVAAGVHEEPGAAQVREAAGTKLEALRRDRRRERCDRYATIRRLRDAGLPPRLIAPRVGMSQRSIERWLTAGGEPDHRRPPVTTLIDPFRPYLEQRWHEGCHSAAALWREVKAQGFTGSFNTVARWATLRREPCTPSLATHVAPAASWRAPSRRRCAWLLGLAPDKLTASEQNFIAHLAAAAPALAVAADLARRFAAMVDTADATGLNAWLAAAQGSEFAALAEGLARDLPAVRAAITEPWSTSPVEGHINRVKTIKRQMYGRAGHDLLRKRVLAA